MKRIGKGVPTTNEHEFTRIKSAETVSKKLMVR